MKRNRLLLCLLLAAALVLAGCQMEELSIVDGKTDQAPRNGTFRMMFYMAVGTGQDAPNKNMTLNDVSLVALGDSSSPCIILHGQNTGKDITITDLTVDPDPSVTFDGRDNGGAPQVGILCSYRNLDPDTYNVTSINAGVRYLTTSNEYFVRTLHLGNVYANSFTVTEKTQEKEQPVLPNTGDHAVPLMWGTLLVLSGAAVVLLRRRSRA